MPCSNLSIHKNYKCDIASCFCIQTGGNPCICLCENQNGKIMKCDDCNCSTDSCQCKCDNSKCTCFATKGADCICVCRDETGSIKTCDCLCTELGSCQKDSAENGKCCMKSEKVSCMKSDNCQPQCNNSSCTCIVTKAGCVRVCRNTRGSIKKCDCSCTELKTDNSCCNELSKHNNCCQEQLNKGETIDKSYKSFQAECVCVPTGEKPCICICDNGYGGIMKCDDCKCSTESGQCKCDNSKCTCVVTKGADCICVCRDETGNFNTCDCSCTELESCQKDSAETCKCCMQSEKVSCMRSDNCQPKCNNSSCTCIVTKGGCVRVCRNTRGSIKKCDCSCTELKADNSCCNELSKHNNCSQEQLNKGATIDKTYKCLQAECVCVPTGEKPYICICDNGYGGIMKCDDCKCSTESGQYKCDNCKCTCVVTKGADCICVCRDETGNFKTCDCSCTELGSCQKDSVETGKCCMKSEKVSCMRSDNCQPKCSNSSCTCIATKAGCVRVCRNTRGSIKNAGSIRGCTGPKSCSKIENKEVTNCCSNFFKRCSC